MKKLFPLALILRAGCAVSGGLQLAPGTGPGPEETPDPVVVIVH